MELIVNSTLKKDVNTVFLIKEMIDTQIPSVDICFLPQELAFKVEVLKKFYIFT